MRLSAACRRRGTLRTPTARAPGGADRRDTPTHSVLVTRYRYGQTWGDMEITPRARAWRMLRALRQHPPRQPPTLHETQRCGRDRGCGTLWG